MRAVSMIRSILVILISSVMMGVPSLAAQTLPPPDGITVTGSGYASAQPDSSLLQITLSSVMFGQPMPPEPGATPGAAESEAALPVVDNLIAAGVAESDINVVVPPFLGNAFSGPYGPASALINVTITEPTAESMMNLISAATVGAADSGMMIGGIYVIHTVNDCAPLESEARRAAFADAQGQASIQADIMGVSLGEVRASRDYPYALNVNTGAMTQMDDDGSCTSAGMTEIYGPFGPVPYDLSTEPEVVVQADLDVTFGIDDGSEATPAS